MAKLRRAESLLANTRISVDTIDPPDELGVTRKFIVRDGKAGRQRLAKNIFGQRYACTRRSVDDGADDERPGEIVGEAHEAAARSYIDQRLVLR